MSDGAGSNERPDSERIHKVLARIGLGSRRSCEQLVEQGRVEVNGKTAGVGTKIGRDDVVAVDGVIYSVKPALVTYLLNKPRGVISTAADPQGRTTVVELVKTETRIFPVGRLDAETEGLLLLTNDGELANRLMHPRYGVEKEYLAQVRGKVSRRAVKQLRDGVQLSDGMTNPARVSLVDELGTSSVLKLVIHEGRNRQVRRMCEAVGHPVERLVRSRYGPITEPKLKPGESRELSRDELVMLQKSIATPRGGKLEI